MNKLKLLETFLIHQGEQRFYSHYSDILDCEMQFAIFLPKSALGKNPEYCPSIYYLSGLTCNEKTAPEKLSFQRLCIRYDTIFICPDTSPRGKSIPDDSRFWVGQGAGYYINSKQSPWDKNYQMSDYITKELFELIQANFPVNGRQSIFGHSMGGFGAISLGLKNPTQYACISAYAPICSVKDSPWLQDAFSKYLDHNQDDWDQNDPCQLIKKAEQRPPIRIDYGSKDQFLDYLGIERFKRICEQLDYPASIYLREGYDHSYYFLRSFIAEHFVFHSDHLEN